MVYSKESSKWKAYQFSDPFATNSFLVCNRVTSVVCRPDCDSVPKTSLKSDVKFIDAIVSGTTVATDEAIANGFSPCKYCDPSSRALFDVKLLMQCVEYINNQIGFLNPLVDEDEDFNNHKIKENILESKISNKQHILKVLSKDQMARRQSVPSIQTGAGTTNSDLVNSVNLTKNDGDHYRLVDLACRHLAYAAAVNLFFPKKYLEEDCSEGGKKKRRRGGVLGFKELAAKSKLSAWHFHRVFKSVTGLTPKTYGDKCNEYLEKYKDSEYINYNTNRLQTPSPQVPAQVMVSPSVSPRAPPSKRQRVDISTVQAAPVAPINQLQQPVPELNQFTFEDRSYSMPNLYNFDFQYPASNMMQPLYQDIQMPQQPIETPSMQSSVAGPVYDNEYPISSSISPATSLDMEEMVPSLFQKDYKIELPDKPMDMMVNDFGYDMDYGYNKVEFDNGFDDYELNDFLTIV